MTALPPSKLRQRRPRAGMPLPRPRALPVSLRASAGQNGFSLIEALVALFILTIIALGLGQVIGLGMLSNQAADDLTQATTLSADKLEELRASEYWALTEGGSLDTAEAGYADSPDIDGDGTAEFERRWQITDQKGGKRLEVRTLSLNDTIGNGRRATIATVVAER